jgi:hypothetical protein
VLLLPSHPVLLLLVLVLALHLLVPCQERLLLQVMPLQCQLPPQQQHLARQVQHQA